MTKLKQDYASTWAFEIDNINRYAFWKDAFNDAECEVIKSLIKENYALQKGGIVGDPQKLSDIRDSNIVFVQPIDDLRWVYQRLTDITLNLNERFFGFDLFGFTEGLQFTEYSAPGGKYDQHIDKIYGGVIRKLSIVVQLTDPSEYDGGDFEIMDGSTPEKLFRDKGTLIAFPSYTLHRVTPVTRGTRNSLVGWVTGKPFK